MQDGIGRGGYRLLASVFLGIGVLGLATTLYAFRQANAPRGFFDWLGFALTLVGLLALFAVSLTTLMKRGPDPEPDPTPTPAGAPTRDIGFEFTPTPEPAVPEVGEEVAIPIAVAPREPRVVQPNRNIGRDAKGWPSRQPPSGLTMGERRELQHQAVQMLTSTGADAEEIEFESSPPRARNGHAPPFTSPVAKSKPKGRDMSIRVEAPVSIARVAGPDDDMAWNPEGTTVGKCGGCGTRLYAPKERPINLRCPKCAKLTMLK